MQCTFCTANQPEVMFTTQLTTLVQPSENPDPMGLAGYEPTEQFPPIPLNVCIWCMSELVAGMSCHDLVVQLQDEGAV